ncbi:MAG: polysaccharide deacetylase family protein [Candidatus Diapherotrites archaeon]|nr:polysaccharide deacetylase family protein [Candidatus Diapherotrites archaeon]
MQTFLLYHNPDPIVFEKHILFLKKHYVITPVSEALSLNSVPSKPAVSITFDDAYRNNYLNIFPLLQKHSISAMVFVPTGFIGSIFLPAALKEAFLKTKKKNIILSGYGKLVLGTPQNAFDAWHKLIWNIIQLPSAERDLKIREILYLLQVSEDSCTSSKVMSAEELSSLKKVIEIGNHTVTHPDMLNLSLEETRFELEVSKKEIEKLTGQSCMHFAYPYGKKENYSKQTVLQVEKAGFKFAFTAIPIQSAKQKPFELARIGIGDKDSVALLCLKLTPVWPIFWRFS